MKKILFIHGYSQNAHIFRSKTAVIRKQLALFECIYINAPHKVPAPNDPQVDERAWWNAEQTESGMKYTGISTSLDMLNNEWKTGEYVGIIGFSQGAWHDGLTQHGQHLCPATSSPAIVHDCVWWVSAAGCKLHNPIYGVPGVAYNRAEVWKSNEGMNLFPWNYRFDLRALLRELKLSSHR
jgi:Serine hydrolase (FSH1)